MKLLSAFILFLFLKINCIAQVNSASVSGRIIDDNGHATPSASVALLSLKDSSLNKVVLTSATGDFEMKGLSPGKYFLSVTSIGYKKGGSNGFELKEAQSYFLAPITLSTDHTKLSDVDVQSKKPMIEVTADKTIFNIEGSLNATGSNAFELLQKSPGVTIDNDDNISLKGKNGVRIYIDGKPAQVAGKDLSEFLRSVNSADLEAIEMISNPSAKYDASGNAGIINLRLKKNKNFGTNGSVTAGIAIAHSLKENGSFNINHRDKAINIFGNYSNNFGQRRSFFNLYRIQNDTIYDQHVINYSDPHIHNFKTGADFFINAKNTIGFIVNGNFSNNTYSNDGYALIMKNGSSVPLKILYASGVQDVKRSNLNYNVNYHFVSAKGAELIIDADLGRFRSKAASIQPNQYKTPSGVLLDEKIYRNNTPTDINIETFKADYEMQAGKGRFGFGGKYSKVKTMNTFDFYNVISGNPVMDSARSNQFNYTENINAGYINFTSPLGKKWNMRAGIRMENTHSIGDLISYIPRPEDYVERDYVDFFPSGALTHTPGEKNSFSFSYSRRIDRPNYVDLNPFEDKIDELTYQKGNAFLRPQYSNIFELTHTYNSRFNTTLSYSHIKDYRTNIIDTTDKNRVFRTVKNLASQDIFNLNFSVPVDITTWWKAFFTANAYRSLYNADFGLNKKIDLSVFAYNFFTQQTFTLTEGLTFELSGSYNSPNIWGGTFKTDAIYSADAGIQKSLFKKKGNLKVSLTDIFQTQKFSGISDFGGAYLDISGQSESRQLRINFTYRFGNNQVKSARQHKMGSDEEIDRIQ
ncbi:MAG TPA: TonB-dependent receptor [Chitinophagaceae bacterium]|nr:TonB-dependent receptor [Chitinophagaceae bacterium]